MTTEQVERDPSQARQESHATSIDPLVLSITEISTSLEGIRRAERFDLATAELVEAALRRSWGMRDALLDLRLEARDG